MMLGADYSRGALTVGLSVGRSLGLGRYDGAHAGEVSTSMRGLYPWLGYRLNERFSVWGVAGYGTGSLSLTPGRAAALETGMSMAMGAAGARGELVGSPDAGGFALAFKADAFWVGASTALVAGDAAGAGRLNASDAGGTRVRAALEGSRRVSVGGRMSLTPSIEVGVRQDGGDADVGTGMDVGGGLRLTDAVTGLSVDMRVRTLLVHQAEGFSERGMSLSIAWDPTPETPLGVSARLAPQWGGQAAGGAETLWGQQNLSGLTHGGLAQGNRLDGEVAYGLPLGSRFVGAPRAGMGTSAFGRDYRLGYGMTMLQTDDVQFELGFDGQRREIPLQDEADLGLLGRARLGW